MKIIYGIGKVKPALKNAVVAIGVFDGLHRGHQKLIKEAVKYAQMVGGKAVVMTFSPHPVQVLDPDKYLPFVVSLNHRLELIKQLGVGTCVVVHFTKRFSRLLAQKFIKNYLVRRFHPNAIFIGEDFRFGRGREGTLESLKMAGEQYGFSVKSVAPLKEGGAKMGSSLIRTLIHDGELSRARKLLGREISIKGRIIRGDRRGAKLGFPTINIIPDNVVLPPVGVYAAYVIIKDEKFRAMANVGYRPSFQSSCHHISVEAHMFDFRRKLYGQTVIIEFLKKIRDEEKFLSADHLVEQLKRDEKVAKKILDGSLN